MLENRSMPEATVIPVLLYDDVPAAAAWLCRAFGFRERLRIGGHRVQLAVGAGAVVVAHGSAGMDSVCGHSVMVRVDDADAHCARAGDAEARILHPPVTYPYGERQYSAVDPWGHGWTFSQTVEDVDPETWGGEAVADPRPGG